MARNLLRDWNTGKLSKPDLRIAAVYRLLSKGRITSKARAIELLTDRGTKAARATVELWLAHPLKHLPITA